MSMEVIKFNTLLEEFIEKIITAFSSEKLLNYRRGFLFLKKMSPTSPVNLFMSGCIEYKKAIVARNDSFFLKDRSVNEKAKVFGNFTEDCGIDSYWNVLSPSTKTAIWDYIQSLFVLGEIIVNKNKEMFKKYNTFYVTDYKKEIDDLHTENFSLSFLSKINS